MNISKEMINKIYESQIEGLAFLENYDKGNVKLESFMQNNVQFLDCDDVVFLHEKISGSKSIRDENLLETALSRGVNAYLYSSPSIEEVGLLIAEGIIRNHPFTDGNKRTAQLAFVAFLDINGSPIPDDPNATAKILLGLATRKLDIIDASRYMMLNKKKYLREDLTEEDNIDFKP